MRDILIACSILLCCCALSINAAHAGILQPASVDFQTLTSLQTRSLAVKVTNPLLIDVSIQLKVTSPFTLSATSVIVPASKSGTVQVSIPGNTAPGMYRGSLTASDAKNRFAAASVPVQALVIDPAKALSPSLNKIDFGSVGQGDGTSTIDISYEPKVLVKVKRIDAFRSPFFSRVGSIPFLATANFTVAAGLTRRDAGSFQGTYVVTYRIVDGANNTEIGPEFTNTLPLSAIIIPKVGVLPAGIDLVPFLGRVTVTPPAAGETRSTVTVPFSVHNQGPDPSVPCTAKVFLGDNEQASVDVPSVAPTRDATFTISFRTGRSGSHTVRVLVDVNGTNSEIDENNNEGDQRIDLP